jgi:hypothetical protein
MPSPRRQLLALLAALAALAAAAIPALAQGGGTPPTGGTPTDGDDDSGGRGDSDDRDGPGKRQPPGVCDPARVPRLRCPDLVMRQPYAGYFVRVGSRVRYHAANSIVNVGQGPAEIFGYRSSSVGPMRAVQRIHGFNRRRYSFPSPEARVVFKHIPYGPGAGSYWKFENAARFEIWTLDDDGELDELVRTGGKLIYCLRDLNKRRFLPLAPLSRVYPACNQDPRRRFVTLGTSVGWADEYPANYYEQYIDVTGLRGRYAFVQRVDPVNGIRESNERNNVSPRVFLQLPPRSMRGGGGNGGGY